MTDIIPLHRANSKQPSIHPRINRGNWAGRKSFVVINPTKIINIPTHNTGAIVGSAPTRTIGKYGEELKFSNVDALNFIDPNIGANDFLATMVLDRGTETGLYQYILSGTTATAGGGIHLYIKHASASDQWGLHNVTAKGSGNVLSTNTRYVLSVRRVGTTVYFLQDGEPTATASVSLNAASDVFLDQTWSVNQYRPANTYRGNPGIAHISVLKGTFTENHAKSMSSNPWQVYGYSQHIPVEAPVAGGTTLQSSLMLSGVGI